MHDIKLSVAIMAVPERVGFVDNLLEKLEPDRAGRDVSVYWDHDKQGLWWNAHRIWTETPATATHRMLLNDDIEVCRDFLPAVEAAIRARPDSFINFFCYGPAQEATLAAGKCWMPYTNPSGCAYVLPSAWVRDFIEWGDNLYSIPFEAFAKTGHKKFEISDDTFLLTWLQMHQKEAWVAVPGLAKHLAWNDSVFLHTPRESNVPTELYIGANRSGLEIDWSRLDTLEPTITD
jgi:hypothetical protein